MICILMEVTKDYESLSLLFLNLSVSEEPNLNQNLECFTSIRKSIFKWKNVPTVISVDQRSLGSRVSSLTAGAQEVHLNFDHAYRCTNHD